jgi:aldehyde:ferredoxin oxidoreductase
MRWGERRNHLMRVYNLREGLSKKDDVLPDRFYQRPIDFGRLQGAVFERAEFNQLVELLYEMNGWDADGVPLPGTLYDHHLEWTLPYLNR